MNIGPMRHSFSEYSLIVTFKFHLHLTLNISHPSHRHKFYICYYYITFIMFGNMLEPGFAYIILNPWIHFVWPQRLNCKRHQTQTRRFGSRNNHSLISLKLPVQEHFRGNIYWVYDWSVILKVVRMITQH